MVQLGAVPGPMAPWAGTLPRIFWPFEWPKKSLMAVLGGGRGGEGRV
jgi:hypothetical protein